MGKLNKEDNKKSKKMQPTQKHDKKPRKPQKQFRTLKAEQIQKNKAPAKNLLVNFKKYHIEFAQKLGQGNHPLIKKMRESSNTNMKTYQQLYKDPTLREKVFKKYFQWRQIYRDLMRSRVNLQNKIKYIKYLPRFQQAFEMQTFDHINK